MVSDVGCYLSHSFLHTPLHTPLILWKTLAYPTQRLVSESFTGESAVRVELRLDVSVSFCMVRQSFHSELSDTSCMLTNVGSIRMRER